MAFVYFVYCVSGISETIGYVQLHWRNGSEQQARIVCCVPGSGSLQTYCHTQPNDTDFSSRLSHLYP